ncbi:MAG: hypothetical protein CSB15_01230 [Clostridiales bacterium]|nr:MAG: hypothetical protein CSB15_01230 [Clostridiales bacterium]
MKSSNIYHKYNSLKGSYFTRTQIKIKHHQDKLRYIREETVIKQFKDENAIIYVHFDGSDRVVELDYFSSEDDIKKYLGKKFLD